MSTPKFTFKVDQLFMSVSIIIIKKGNDTIGTATGFFYKNESHLFLCTNRHVVIDERSNWYPDKLVIKLHNKNDILTEVQKSLDLYDGHGHPKWLEIKKIFDPNDDTFCNGKIDLVLIEIDKAWDDVEIHAFTTNDIFPGDHVITIADDFIVIGYPKGYYDEKNNLPIVKKVSLASVPGMPFEGNPIFLLDGMLKGGMSGSPVLTAPTNLIRKRNKDTGKIDIQMIGGSSGRIYLLGIMSWSIPSVELHGAWYAITLDTIIEQSI